MRKPLRTILVIDDDRIFCSSISEFLGSDTRQILTANTGAEGIEICAARKIDVALLDQRLPDMEGHFLCPSLLSHHDQLKIIFTTAYPSFEHAVKAIRAGAYDYLSKPFELGELELAVNRALRTLDLEDIAQLQQYRNAREVAENEFIGASGCLADVARIMNLAAGTEAPVLITGETGTGKNVVARSIHYRGLSGHAQKTERDSPFVGINCAALPENLIEAELFGHEKGAFTGAVASKKGIFEMADGGTLFLDEIGDMPLHLQSKLLGVLDDRKIKRLGGETVRTVDVRIVAATSVDLEEAVRQKRFRGDLYYRLSVIRIHIPPLRERRDDIAALCAFLLRRHSRGHQVHIAQSEIDALRNYEWPGNVRELSNVIERAVILQRGPDIRPSELLCISEQGRQLPTTAPASVNAKATLDEVEKNQILSSLEQNSGNYTRTAQALGISLSTLKRRLRAYRKS